MRFFRMLGFQTKQFAATPFFTQTLIITTVSAVVIQWLFIYGQTATATASELVWLRAAVTGSWTLTCMSAGILGFQRFQGVLHELVFARVGVLQALLPVSGSTVIFGVIAFPLALLVAALFGHYPRLHHAPLFICALLLFVLSSLLIALVVAMFFMLTPNALTYEPLIVIPVVLLSGIYGYPAQFASVLAALGSFVPISFPVTLMQGAVTGTEISALGFAYWAGAALLWLFLVFALKRTVITRVARTATLEVA